MSLHSRLQNNQPFYLDYLGGVLVSVLAKSVVDRWFDPRSGHNQTENYKIGICCFCVKYAAYKE
jgi:hypothetical protein